MSFKVTDKKLLKRYSKIWERVSRPMNTEFHSESVSGDNEKYITTKIKSYGYKVNPNFPGNNISKENASRKCLSLIMLDSVITVNKKYYPQSLLEECKYKVKMENLINDRLALSSSDNKYHDESDDELDNQSND